jgi:hypothetical protein
VEEIALKRILLGLLTAVVVLGMASTSADARTKRVVRKATGTYASPALGFAPAGGFADCSPQDGFGCVAFKVKPKERFVRFTIADHAGGPVAGAWCQDPNGDGFCGDTGEPFGHFCGKTKKAAAIKPGLEVDVFVYEGFNADPPCPTFPTSGTVKAVFSNIR